MRSTVGIPFLPALSGSPQAEVGEDVNSRIRLQF